MNDWVIESLDARDRALFPDLDGAIENTGEEINANWMSRLIFSRADHSAFYIKVYASRGRGLRRWLGRSRLRAEWENLLLFADLGVPTAEVVAYGEQQGQAGYRGVLVTREIDSTVDLAQMVRDKHPQLANPLWRKHVIHRLSDGVRKLHAHGFIHNDLKWRNILVESKTDPGVFIIDCPLGRKMRGPFLTRGRIKDLACLDKVGHEVLSRADRLRFYLAYTGRKKLNRRDKAIIARVLGFFAGRE